MGLNKELKQSIKTARITGIWYLMMAISGILGFMVFHSEIFVSGNPEQTLTNLVELKSTARIRLLLEFAIVISQALTAVWFFKLFKENYEWEAWTLGIWGMVNALVIMTSAISIASAIGVANSDISAMEDKVVLIQVFQHIRMPVWLGRVIVLGGIGYLISTVIRYAGIEFSFNRFLTLPATIGEFWMIGYLLIFGIRPMNKQN